MPRVTFDLWQLAVAPGRLARGSALLTTLTRHARATGATFAIALGTADASLRIRGATPLRWALLCAWPDPATGDGWARHPAVRRLDALAHVRGRLVLQPLTVRGAWAGAVPWQPAPDGRWEGAAVAITRAKLRRGRSHAFRAAGPAVATAAAAAPGLRAAMGIGERPVGVAGTVTVWDSVAAMADFAHGTRAHLDAVARSRQEQWYAEDLFATFGLVSGELA